MELPDRQATIAVNAALVVLSVALLAITAGAIAASWGGTYWLLDCAVGVAATALALGRRRHPARMAIAALCLAATATAFAELFDLPHEPGPATVLALAVLVASAVRRLPPYWAGGIAAGGLAVVLGSWLIPQPASKPSVVVGLNAVGWLVAVAVGAALRTFDERRRGMAELVRRDERLALARELHDVVAHHITGIIVQAQAAQVLTRRQSEQLARSEQLTQSLAGIELAGTDALDAMRRVVGLLRDADDAAPASSGPEQLSALVERFRRHGPAVELRLPDEQSAWPPEVTTTVYRIVQEALTNVSRHAPHAQHVSIVIEQRPRFVTVEVADDAAPARPRSPRRGGYGLVGMRERIQTLGGTLLVGPRPGAGWSVLATLPVPGRDTAITAGETR